MGISRRDVPQTLLIALIFIMADEGGDLLLKIVQHTAFFKHDEVF